MLPPATSVKSQPKPGTSCPLTHTTAALTSVSNATPPPREERLANRSRSRVFKIRADASSSFAADSQSARVGSQQQAAAQSLGRHQRTESREQFSTRHRTRIKSAAAAVVVASQTERERGITRRRERVHESQTVRRTRLFFPRAARSVTVSACDRRVVTTTGEERTTKKKTHTRGYPSDGAQQSTHIRFDSRHGTTS